VVEYLQGYRGDSKICGWGIGLPDKVYLGSAIRGLGKKNWGGGLFHQHHLLI